MSAPEGQEVLRDEEAVQAEQREKSRNTVPPSSSRQQSKPKAKANFDLWPLRKKKKKCVVECNGKKGIFNLPSFHSGQFGKCIFYDKKWITPNQFEKAAGSKSKKYKRSLKIGGEPLGKYLDRKGVQDPTRKRICEMGKCSHFD